MAQTAEGERGASGAWRAAAPWLALVGVALGLTGALLAPWLADPTGRVAVGAFHPGHAWAFQHMAHGIAGQVPLGQTSALGFPEGASLAFVGWVPALLVAPLQLAGPLLAYGVAVWISPALSALGTAWCVRVMTGAAVPVAAAAGLTAAFSAHGLASLANGQIAKVQLWCVPVVLACCHRAVQVAGQGEGGLFARPGPAGRWLTLAGLGTVATVFTAPSYAVHLPLVLAVWALGWVAVGWRTPERLGPATQGVVLAALVVVAVCLLPARNYYLGDGAGMAAFSPGALDLARPQRGAWPFAGPLDLLLGIGPRDFSPADTNHAPYLGLPLVFAAAWASRRPFPGRGLGWALVVLGVTVALGPRLSHHGALVSVGGNHLALPAALLDAVGYPLGESGMYYRAVAISSLGLALVLGGLRWPVSALGLLVAVGLGDGLRATGHAWPRPAVELPGAQLLARIAQDPTPGAVLELPLEHTDVEGQWRVLGSTLHGRATTAVLRDSAGLPHVERLEAVLHDADQRGAVALQQAGIGHVVFRAGASTGPDAPWSTPDAIQRVLGPPQAQGELTWWRVGP